MIANISLTQVVGDIITSIVPPSVLVDLTQLMKFLSALYPPGKETEKTIIAKVQTILDSLHHIAQTLPAEVVIDFNQRHLQVSRTSASLHLDIFQVS